RRPAVRVPQFAGDLVVVCAGEPERVGESTRGVDRDHPDATPAPRALDGERRGGGGLAHAARAAAHQHVTVGDERAERPGTHGAFIAMTWAANASARWSIDAGPISSSRNGSWIWGRGGRGARGAV